MVWEHHLYNWKSCKVAWSRQFNQDFPQTCQFSETINYGNSFYIQLMKNKCCVMGVSKLYMWHLITVLLQLQQFYKVWWQYLWFAHINVKWIHRQTWYFKEYKVLKLLKYKVLNLKKKSYFQLLKKLKYVYFYKRYKTNLFEVSKTSVLDVQFIRSLRLTYHRLLLYLCNIWKNKFMKLP